MAHSTVWRKSLVPGAGMQNPAFMISLNDTAAGTPIYRLKITLKDSKPPIWRAVLVRSDMRLDRLHKVIQIAMGWHDCHLHQFVIGAKQDAMFFGVPDPEFQGDIETLNEKKYTINDLMAGPKAKCMYEYDFGDGWLHDVVWEIILPADAGFKHPVCLDGANACPPEDCGGLWGYYESFLKAVKNLKHPEHKAMKEWFGGPFDPAHFDLEGVNAKLKRIKA